MTIEAFTQVRTIAPRYKALLVDLWGVIHDGQQMYPDVTETLEQLRTLDVTVIFLSNAPRRAERAIEGLDRFGVDRSLYHSVITSGEITYEHISSNAHNLGKKYYIIGPSRDDGLLSENKDYIQVTSPEEADFLIVTGFDHDASTLDEKMSEIEAGLQRELPLVCANPDLEVVRITGARALCAGVIADYYKEQGGTVYYFGKPYPDIYQKALSVLDIEDKSTIAAIGDNLHTDILGANQLGIDSFLVPSGILSDVFGIEHGELPNATTLLEYCKERSIVPTAALAAFNW
jgi:HAD superfamily hydrolase (TIGR01459 family)